MKIDKAIENLRVARMDDCGLIPPSEYTPTIDLAIVALLFRQRWEEQEGEEEFPLLPGETKE